MNDLPWFSMYPTDFLVSTAMMTPTQGWAYTQLLMYAWTNGGVPDDRERCASMTRCPLTEEDWLAVRARFVVMATPLATLCHPRMERERAEALERRNTAAEHGRAGAKARWGRKNGVANGDPNGHPNGDPNGHPNGVANARGMPATTTTTTTNKSARSARSSGRANENENVDKAKPDANDPGW